MSEKQLPFLRKNSIVGSHGSNSHIHIMDFKKIGFGLSSCYRIVWCESHQPVEIFFPVYYVSVMMKLWLGLDIKWLLVTLN